MVEMLLKWLSTLCVIFFPFESSILMIGPVMLSDLLRFQFTSFFSENIAEILRRLCDGIVFVFCVEQKSNMATTAGQRLPIGSNI